MCRLNATQAKEDGARNKVKGKNQQKTNKEINLKINKKLIQISESPTLAITYDYKQVHITYKGEKTIHMLALWGLSLQKRKS